MNIEKELILKSTASFNGRVWTLCKQDFANTEGVKGKDLLLLITSSANNTPLPSHLTYLQEIKRNPKFKRICRLIPGIESERHKRIRNQFNKVLFRLQGFIKSQADLANKGIDGCFLKSDYFFCEILFDRININDPELRCYLNSLNVLERKVCYFVWMEDKSLLSSSYEQWIENKWNSFKKVNVFDLTFVQWLHHEYHKCFYIKAWEESKSCQNYQDWLYTQFNYNISPYPKFILNKYYLNQQQYSWDEWINLHKSEQISQWEEFKQLTGFEITFETFNYYYSYCSIYEQKKTLLGGILKQVRNQSFLCENGLDEEKYKMIDKLLPLNTFWEKTYFNNLVKKMLPGLSFDEFLSNCKKAKETNICCLNIDLEKHKVEKQQLFNPFQDVPPIFYLKEEERAKYRIEIKVGYIYRNQKPLSTEYFQTAHTGNGIAIFVIGPDGYMYVANNILNIFHHSSFFSGKSVIAAGEIRTNALGKITYINNISGHYQPGDKANLYLLTFLEKHGIDLADVVFELTMPNNKNVSLAASAYKKILEMNIKNDNLAYIKTGQENEFLSFVHKIN